MPRCLFVFQNVKWGVKNVRQTVFFLDKSSSTRPPPSPNTQATAERWGAIQVCQATRDWKAQSSLPCNSFGNGIKFREWLKGREWINDLTLDRVIIKPRLPSPDVTWDDVGSQSALLWIRISLQSVFSRQVELSFLESAENDISIHVLMSLQLFVVVGVAKLAV